MEKVLEMLPADKQNIVYTNRRSRETQDILDKILKSPQEIKVDKDKECEAQTAAPQPAKTQNNVKIDDEAVALSKKYDTFKGHTPKFLLFQGNIAENGD